MQSGMSEGDFEIFTVDAHVSPWIEDGQVRSHVPGMLETELGVAGTDLRYNLTWHDWMNLESLITVSRAIRAAAHARTDSRGAHFREDFPDRLDSWMKHTLAWADAQTASVKIDYRPVHTKPLSGEVRYFPPEEQIR